MTSKVVLRCSCLCVLRAAGSLPPGLETSRHPERRRVCRARGTVRRAGPRVSADRPRPRDGWGRPPVGEGAGLSGTRGRLRTPSLLPEMVSSFDSLHRPVALAESQLGPSGGSKRGDASGARRRGRLGPAPAPLARTSRGTWAPLAARGRLFKKRQAASHSEVCNCPSVAQIKKNFFPSIAKNFSNCVQWSSHRGEGAGRSQPFSFRASSWVRGEDAHRWEGERGSIPGGCQEKHYRLFKTIRELYKSPLSLVKNKLESSEVIFFLYSKQVPVVYIYRVLEGWGSTLLRASLWLVRVRACVLVLSVGAFSLPHLKRDAHVTLLAGIPPLPLSCAPSVRSNTYPLRGLLSSFPAGECL